MLREEMDGELIIEYTSMTFKALAIALVVDVVIVVDVIVAVALLDRPRPPSVDCKVMKGTKLVSL